MDGDDKIDKDEFHQLLSNVFWFAKLHSIFDDAAGADHELDCNDFKRCMEKLGVQMTQVQATTAWRELDTNSSGIADFAEFCDFMRHKVCGEGMQHQDDADRHAKSSLRAMKEGGHNATMGGMVQK